MKFSRSFALVALAVRCSRRSFRQPLPRGRSRPRNTRGCSGGSSGRYAVGEPRRSPVCRALPNRFYIAAVNGGIWRTDDAGRTWTSHLRRTVHRIDRIARCCGQRSEHRSTPEAARACNVPISRSATESTSRPTAAYSWKHLGLRDGKQIPQIAVDPTDPQTSFRRSPRTSVRTQSRTRHLPFAGRWYNVQAGALSRRKHRCIQRQHRSIQSANRLRDAVGGAASPVGNRCFVRAARKRHLQVDRRRRSVDAFAGRSSGRDGTRRNRSRTVEHRRSCTHTSTATASSGGAVFRSDDGGAHFTQMNDDQNTIGERGDDLVAIAVDPKDPQTALCHEHVDVSFDRRRQAFHRDQGRTRRRRLSKHLDQSERSEHHRPRERSGRNDLGRSRRDVEFVVQPADRADVSRQYRQSLSLLGLRRTTRIRFGLRPQPRRLGRDHRT